MDYLYINAIVKEVYKDLSCGCPFPAEYGKTMHSTLSAFDCLSNPKIPDVLGFFTVRSKGQATAMVFSRVQKHTNSASVGRFTQSIGWTWDGNLLFRNPDEMLNVGFYTEEEINSIALQGGSFALPKDRRSSYKEIPISLSPRIKQAILTTVILRWLRFEAPLRIAVPKNVDYNCYVLSAMKQIYKLFPVSLRARAGFCSYLPSDKNLPETISIGFVPEEMADSRTLSLDGSSQAACNTLNCGTNNTAQDTFIAYLASASDANRQKLLEEIFEDLEESGSNEKVVQVVPRHYQTIGTALGLLAMEGTLPELKKEWDKRFFENLSQFSPRMQSRIREKIRKTVDPAEFCKLAEKRLATEGFQGLKEYQNYCIDNPALTDALWNTVLRLQVERKRSYTDIYAAVTKRGMDLGFILSEEKLSVLFSLSVKEQLQVLQADSVTNLADVQKLLSKTGELVTYAGSRADAETDKADVLKFYYQLQKQEKQLILEGLTADFQHLQNKPLPNNVKEVDVWLEELSQFREKAAKQNAVPGTDRLLEETDRFVSKLQNYKNELIYNLFLNRFNEIVKQPVRTAEQIDAVIKNVQALLEKTESGPKTVSMQTLQHAMAEFITSKQEDLNSSQIQFLRIDRILENPTLDYFQILEELDQADKRQLEDQHYHIIDTKLKELRGRNLELYGKEFQNHYRKPLTLANIAALPTYVFVRVSQDICHLKQLPLSCSLNCKAAETADRIAGALAITGKLSDEHTVDVFYNGNRLDPNWFRNLLCLKLDKSTIGDVRLVEDIFYSLVFAGAFCGRELTGAVEMLNRCQLPFGKLFKGALQGCFTDATEHQYRQAFEMMLQYSKNPTEAAEKMAAAEQSLKDKNSLAVRAFRDVLRNQQQKPSRKPSKGIIAVISVLSVLVVSLSIALVVNKLSKGNIPVDPTDPVISSPTEGATEPTPTQPPVEYPDEFLFYYDHTEAVALLYEGGSLVSFSEHSALVDSLLDMADAETAGLILEQYNQFKGTDVPIDEAATTVKWEEYFFWLLRYHADVDVTQLLPVLQESTLNESVLSILRVINYDLPQENITETVEIEAPSETEATETPVDSAVEGNESTKLVDADAESSVTISDVKTAITDAAFGSYEASRINTAQLPLVLKLFGVNFTQSFSSHADLVAGLDQIGNDQSESYSHFLEHYQIMPGDSVIRFEENGIEVTWDEFVFWECWVLAQQGITTVDAQTFNMDLYAQVEEVLSVVHQLVSNAEQNVNPEDISVSNGAYSAEYEINSVLLNIIQTAKESFEKEQSIYRAIWVQLQEQ